MPKPSPDTPDKRQQIITAVAEHLLHQGFRNSGLRALAKSAGVSDRMVMYYFKTKEELIAQALLFLASGFVVSLESLLPDRKTSGAKIVDALVTSSLSAEAKPMMKLWFEIVGLAVRNDEPYKTTAALFLAEWERWIADKLEPKQQHRASELLAQVEGEVMLKLLKS